MVTAYITVKAHTGEADRLKTDIERFDGVERAHIIAGDFDLIAIANVDSPADVKDIAATKIQSVDGVSNTQTYIAME